MVTLPPGTDQLYTYDTACPPPHPPTHVRAAGRVPSRTGCRPALAAGGRDASDRRRGGGRRGYGGACCEKGRREAREAGGGECVCVCVCVCVCLLGEGDGAVEVVEGRDRVGHHEGRVVRLRQVP